jgi:hypothetical protein
MPTAFGILDQENRTVQLEAPPQGTVLTAYVDGD